MQPQRFEIHKAPVPPLRAEPRHPGPQGGAGHIQGVDVTSGGLIRSTLLAGAAAAAILTLFYLPAEYGVDPTGVGGLLGLTEMGDIKQQLYAEAAAEDAALAAQVAQVQPTASSDVAGRLDRIDAQLSAIAAIIGADGLAQTAAPEPAPEPAAGAEAIAETTAAGSTVAGPASAWRDEASYTLAPGEGIEVKLVMAEGQVAQFEWTANGSVVNYDTHGDGGGNTISYEQGRSVADQTGELVAAFTGNHGWFWRNRTDAPVMLTVRTAGDYAEMKRP